MPSRHRIRKAFVVTAVIEAITWAGLLVGMVLEHVLDVTDRGVWLFGRLHGAAFIAYGICTLLAWWSLRWTWRTAALALLASIPPLFTVVFERWAARTGRLDVA